MSQFKRMSRRDLLQLLAFGSAGAVLAACGGAPAAAPTQAPSTGGEAPAPAADAAPTTAPAADAAPTEAPAADAPTSGGAAPTGEFHGAFPYQVPPTGHWNSFVPDGIPNGISIYWDLLEEPMARYHWGKDEWVYLLAESSEVQPPNKFVVKLRDAVWSDGNPVTSKDVVTTFNVGRLFNWTIFQYVGQVNAVDDKTVEFVMDKPSTLVERLALVERIRSAATYGQYGDRVAQLLADGKDKDSDEWKALLQEVTEFRPATHITSGPYQIDPNTITDASLSMHWVSTAWNADKVQFGTIVLYNGETPAVTPLVLSGDVDYATHGFPPATEQEYMAQGIRIIRAPTYSGPALYFNHDNPILSKKEVRQALAYSIKRDEAGVVSLGQSGVAHKYMIGISDNLVPKWIDDATLAKLNTYDYDLAKAEELLTSIGYSKGSDGYWTDESGTPLAFELTVPAEYADWSATAENVAQQLNNAGFKITVRGIQFQQHAKDIPAGNFTLAINGWGAANPHPSFSWTTPLFTYNYVESTTGKGMNFPLEQEYNGEKIDLQELIVSSAEGLDPEEQKSKISVVAQVFNELLPIVPIFERYGNNPALETRVTGYLPEGDPIYKNAVYGDNFVVMMIQDGTLKPL